MVDKILNLLSRLLYPNERVLEPGQFEAFLSPPIDPAAIPQRYRGRRQV